MQSVTSHSLAEGSFPIKEKMNGWILILHAALLWVGTYISYHTPLITAGLTAYGLIHKLTSRDI